jgi:hypothetical protein
MTASRIADLETGNANVDGLLSKHYWVSTAVTYGFAEEAGDYGDPAAYMGTAYFAAPFTFSPVSAAMEQAYRSITAGTLPPDGVGPKIALTPIEGFSGLRFTEVPALSNPMIMIGKTDGFSGGKAYYPDEAPSG